MYHHSNSISILNDQKDLFKSSVFMLSNLFQITAFPKHLQSEPKLSYVKSFNFFQSKSVYMVYMFVYLCTYVCVFEGEGRGRWEWMSSIHPSKV